MDEENLFEIFFFIIYFIVVVCAILFYCLDLKYRKLVRKFSKNYNFLFTINSKYSFYPVCSEIIKIPFSTYSKRNLELTSAEDVILNYISYNEYNVRTCIKNTLENKKIYSMYLNEINNLNYSLDETFFLKNKVNSKRFYETEKKLIRKKMIKDVFYINILVSMSYVSPKGRNSYCKSQLFNTHELFNLLLKYEQKKANQSIAIVERAKMSPALRFDILKRDGYRCKICGATEKDGVKLQVDHIFPISKGGKTVPSNLQTLCDRCNIGKSDKFL